MGTVEGEGKGRWDRYGVPFVVGLALLIVTWGGSFITNTVGKDVAGTVDTLADAMLPKTILSYLLGLLPLVLAVMVSVCWGRRKEAAASQAKLAAEQRVAALEDEHATALEALHQELDAQHRKDMEAREQRREQAVLEAEQTHNKALDELRRDLGRERKEVVGQIKGELEALGNIPPGKVLWGKLHVVSIHHERVVVALRVVNSNPLRSVEADGVACKVTFNSRFVEAERTSFDKVVLPPLGHHTFEFTAKPHDGVRGSLFDGQSRYYANFLLSAEAKCDVRYEGERQAMTTFRTPPLFHAVITPLGPR